MIAEMHVSLSLSLSPARVCVQNSPILYISLLSNTECAFLFFHTHAKSELDISTSPPISGVH